MEKEATYTENDTITARNWWDATLSYNQQKKYLVDNAPENSLEYIRTYPSSTYSHLSRAIYNKGDNTILNIWKKEGSPKHSEWLENQYGYGDLTDKNLGMKIYYKTHPEYDGFKEEFADGGGVEDKTRVANEILRQLGGMGRIVAMTGAKNFIALPNGVSFRIPNPKANYVKVTLNAMDLYDLEVGRVRGSTYKVLVDEKGVYENMIKPAIEKATGLYLSLGEFKKEEGSMPETSSFSLLSPNPLNKDVQIREISPSAIEHANTEESNANIQNNNNSENKVSERYAISQDEIQESLRKLITDIEEDIVYLKGLKVALENNRIRPNKIIGTGFKPEKARKLAFEYLDRGLASDEKELLEKSAMLQSSIEGKNVILYTYAGVGVIKETPKTLPDGDEIVSLEYINGRKHSLSKKSLEEGKKEFVPAVEVKEETDENVGKEFWFEYHCLESDKSCDANLWHHSHQKVVVLSISELGGGDTQKDRADNGEPRAYRVRFSDGLEWDVFEDELLSSKEDFYRPDPPKKSVESIEEENKNIGFESVYGKNLISTKGNKVNIHVTHYPENEKLKYRLFLAGNPDKEFADEIEAKEFFDTLIDKYKVKGYVVEGEVAENIITTTEKETQVIGKEDLIGNEIYTKFFEDKIMDDFFGDELQTFWNEKKENWDDNYVKQLREAGYNDKDIFAILFGFRAVQEIKCDREFSLGGVLRYKKEFQQKLIDEVIANKKTGYYCLGLKYQVSENSLIQKFFDKYKISNTPIAFDVDKTRGIGDERLVFYKGEGIYVGRQINPAYGENTPLDIFQIINKGYLGIVADSSEKLYDAMMILFDYEETYVKDLNFFFNNIGGIDAKDVFDAFGAPKKLIPLVKKEVEPVVQVAEPNPKFETGLEVSIIDEPVSNTQNVYEVTGHENFNTTYGWETKMKNIYTGDSVTMFENLLQVAVKPIEEKQKSEIVNEIEEAIAYLQADADAGDEEAKEALEYLKGELGVLEKPKVSDEHKLSDLYNPEHITGFVYRPTGHYIVADKDQAFQAYYNDKYPSGTPRLTSLELWGLSNGLLRKIKGWKSSTVGAVFTNEQEVKAFEFGDLVSEQGLVKEVLIGGKADGMSLEDIAEMHGVSLDHILRQANIGIQIEREHTNNLDKMIEIVKDHLFESPVYYTKLQEIESSFENGGAVGHWLDVPAQYQNNFFTLSLSTIKDMVNNGMEQPNGSWRYYFQNERDLDTAIANLNKLKNPDFRKDMPKNLSQLKDFLEIGSLLRVSYNKNRPDWVGKIKVVVLKQSNGLYLCDGVEVPSDTSKKSWIEYPKASDIAFTPFGFTIYFSDKRNLPQPIKFLQYEYVTGAEKRSLEKVVDSDVMLSNEAVKMNEFLGKVDKLSDTIEFENGGKLKPEMFNNDLDFNFKRQTVSCFMTAKSTGRMLILHRAEGDYIGNWSLISGGVEKDEHFDDAIKREIKEELGVDLDYKTLTYIDVTKHADKTHYYCELFVPDEFVPILDAENDDYAWINMGELPSDTHPLLKKYIKTNVFA